MQNGISIPVAVDGCAEIGDETFGIFASEVLPDNALKI